MHHEQGGGPDVREGQGGRGEGERRARRSQRGQGLEELHFEARGGKKNNIEMPQVLCCVFYEKSKVKRKRKEIDENRVSG